MLPSWRKELRIALCPSEVIVLAFSQGFRRKLVARAVLPVIPQNPADWRPAIKSLQQWLAENEFGKLDVKVRLSSCFVRFAAVPFSDSVHEEAERQTVAGLLFESIYGEPARQWQVALDEARYGESCLAAAIDSELAEAIREITSPRRFVTVSVRPYAVSALNAFRRELQEDQGLFAVVDHGHGVLIDIREKKVSGIRKALVGNDPDGHGLINTLRREMLVSGLGVETDKVYLHFAGHAPSIPSSPGMNIVPLQYTEQGNEPDRQFEMTCLEDK